LIKSEKNKKVEDMSVHCNYSDKQIFQEEAVEEPGDGADGQEEGEPEGHELDALGPNHLTLSLQNY